MHKHQKLAKVNAILAALVAALLLLSFVSYQSSVRRADRFERGQKLLPNLDPDEIADIRISKGEEAVRLERQGDRFVVASEAGYPAANDTVNRFLRDVLELGLDKEIGRADDELAAELGLVPGGEEATEVVLADAASKEMVRFVIGNAPEDGGGNYVLRATDAGTSSGSAAEGSDSDSGGGGDGTIYLTAERVYLSTDGDSFVDKDLLDVAADEIAAVRGPDFALARAGVEPQEGSAIAEVGEGEGDEGDESDGAGDGDDAVLGELELVDPPAGRQASATEVTQTAGALAALRFTRHHLADAPEVANLRFDQGLEYRLLDGSGYRVAVAEAGGKHYLRLEGFHTAGRVEVALDADEAEVEQTSEVLVRIDEIADFNDFHGSWIYEVSEFVADKFRVTESDLLEDA